MSTNKNLKIWAQKEIKYMGYNLKLKSQLVQI